MHSVFLPVFLLPSVVFTIALMLNGHSVHILNSHARSSFGNVDAHVWLCCDLHFSDQTSAVQYLNMSMYNSGHAFNISHVSLMPRHVNITDTEYIQLVDTH